MTQGKYITGSDALHNWRDDVLSGKPPTFYPIGDGELKRIEIGPGLVTLLGGAPGAGKTAFTMQAVVDPMLQTELIRLEGECHQRRRRLEQLERRRVRDPQVAALIPSVREALRDFESQSTQLQATAERLVLRAPCAGIVLPSAWNSGLAPHGSLRTWTGSPLQEQNRGCFVRPGTTVCLVGPKESRTAVLLVNQDDINLVRVGQPARMVWHELSGEVLTGRITEIAALDLDLLPRDAVQRLNLPARTTAEGTLVPIGTWYQARVHLDSTDAPLPRGAAGDAKILIDPQSLGTRIIRWLARTFG